MDTSSAGLQRWSRPEFTRFGTVAEMTATWGAHGDKEKDIDREYGSHPFWCEDDYKDRKE